MPENANQGNQHSSIFSSQWESILQERQAAITRVTQLETERGVLQTRIRDLEFRLRLCVQADVELRSTLHRIAKAATLWPEGDVLVGYVADALGLSLAELQARLTEG